MYACPKLRLNCHKDIAVPKARDYVRRYGMQQTPANMYTGDELAPIGQSKIDSILEADALNRDKLGYESREANK